MHYKSQVSINYYSTLSSECIQESLPDQLTIDRSSFRVPWWLLWLITTLPSSVAAWQSSFDIFPNCCGCSSHHEVLSWPQPAPITRWWSVILQYLTDIHNNTKQHSVLRSLFIRDIIWQESRTLKNEKFLFTMLAGIINDCVEGMRALVSFIFPIIQNRRQSSRELLECPVHTSPLPCLGATAIFHLAGEWGRGTCQPVKYKLKPSIWISIFWTNLICLKVHLVSDGYSPDVEWVFRVFPTQQRRNMTTSRIFEYFH